MLDELNERADDGDKGSGENVEEEKEDHEGEGHGQDDDEAGEKILFHVGLTASG